MRLGKTKKPLFPSYLTVNYLVASERDSKDLQIIIQQDL